MTGRRRPQQERSRAMVERIVAAARSVLVERGYDGASTNRIAAAAGVSPGSLYQYFPDKEAVLAEVVDRYQAGLEARIARAFVGTLGVDDGVGTLVSATVEAILDALEEEPALLRVVAATSGERRERFARRIDDIATAALAQSTGRPAATAAWMLVRTVENVTVSYVLERPPIARAEVVAELTAMITGYVGLRPRACVPGS